MTLNPLLLLFLPLALIPVILHLITLQRLRTIELSTFRFLFDSYMKQRSRIRLLEWLLMLLRALAVILIIMALSRPMVDRFGGLLGEGSGRDVVLIVDAAATMALRSGGTTSFERARIAAEGIIETLRSDDHVTLVRAGDAPRIVHSGFAGGGESILAAVHAMELASGRSDLARALREATEPRPHGPRIVYMITDGQRQAMAGFDDRSIAADFDPEARLVVVNVGPAEPPVNAAITGQPPAQDRPVVELPVQLVASVHNGAADRTIERTLRLFLDDEQRQQVRLSIPPGERADHAFTFTPRRAGLVRGRFELDPDDFPDDDVFYFCLNVEPWLDVLLVTGPESGHRGERASSYLTAALRAPLEAGRIAAAAEERIAETLRIRQVAYRRLDRSALEEAHVVILSDVPLDASRGAMLKRFVEEGGGLIIFPGAAVDPAAYQQQLLSETGAGGAVRSPIEMRPPQGDIDDERGRRRLGGIDLSHPVLRVFDEQRDRDVEPLAGIRIARHFPIHVQVQEGRAEQLLGRGQRLLTLADGSAVLAEMSLGRGRILIAGFPATADWSNLPTRPAFVPLLLRGVEYVRRGGQVHTAGTVEPGRPATVQLSADMAGSTVEAIDPEGRPIGLTLRRSPYGFSAALQQTQRPGYYRFEITPPDEAGAGNNAAAHTLGFAVSPRIEQADLTMLDEPQMRQALAPIEPVYLRASPQDPLIIEQLRQRSEIWRYLIWALFAIIGIEFLLATLRTGGEEAGAERRRGLGGGRGVWRGLIQRTGLLEVFRRA